MKLRQFGLRVEIVVSLALLVAAAVGLMGMVVFKHSQQAMIALKIESGLNLAEAVGERLNQDASPAAMQRTVDRLAGSGFEGMVVLNPQGRTLAVSSKWTWTSRPSRTDLGQALLTGQVSTYTSDSTFFLFGPDPALGLVVPVFSGSKIIGVVGLSSRLSSLHASWQRTRHLIVLYLLLDTLVMVFFGAYVLHQRFVKPLTRVLGRVKALAAGDYRPGQEPVRGGGEIGELEQAFEVMAQRLTQSRRELEENLRSLKEAQDGLIQSEKMASVGRLAAGLAHELGNPLGAMRGFVHLLGRPGISAPDHRDYLDRIQAEVGRMDTIIRSLLDFARPARTETGPVNLNALIQNSLALAEVQKWYKDLTVVTELSPDKPSALAEANRLTQVLLNLLTNAGQAMPRGGTLTVGTGRARPGEVTVWVRDTGIGISSEDQGKIFDPFFTLKEPGQGTGLGLSISRSIVASFQGRIEVESRLGQGSCFRVFLPAAPGP
jgi:signal transduction histidine kinase